MPKMPADDDVLFHAIAATSARGRLTVTNEGAHVNFIIPPPKTPSGDAFEPDRRTGRSNQERPPKKIVLGPLRRPPLPRSITVIRDVGRRPDGSSPLVLDLGSAIDRGTFTTEVERALDEASRAEPGSDPLRVDALLPPSHEINLSLLARHVAEMGDKIQREIQLRVGSYRPDA